VLSEWDNAEHVIKIAEQITGQVAIPSVMELRYAGRRICEAARIADTDQKRCFELLHDAKFDCLRAQHDAVDISINFIAGFVDKVLVKSEPMALQGKYDAISGYLNRVKEFQLRVAESRQNREMRAEIYRQLTSDLSAVKEDFSNFKVELVRIIEKSDEYYTGQLSSRRLIVDEVVDAQKSRRRYTVFLTGAAILGVAISIAQEIWTRFLSGN
jgi:hypothetical protein